MRIIDEPIIAKNKTVVNQQNVTHVTFVIDRDILSCYERRMEPTTILTDTQSVVLLELGSGNLAMVVYTITIGDVVIVLFLAAMLTLQLLELWRGRRC